VTDPEAARRAIARHRWWQTIEVAPGVVTPGGWDLRPTADRIAWPPSLAGARCLDVGTMDGFWAFELERRGAGEVVASDIVDAGAHDPYDPTHPPGGSPFGGGETFRVAAGLRGSRATFRERSVYELDPDEDGVFDVVFVGYVLQMLRDPLGALVRLRDICRGHLLLLETVSVPLNRLPLPLARLDARRDGREFFVFNRRGLARALELTGWRVEAVTGVLRDRGGPGVEREPRPRAARLLHAAGLRGRSIVVRAAPRR
jgi:tRNA (mo5U34)-methyltransferase